MNPAKKIPVVILAIALSMNIVACGNTKRLSDGNTNSAAAVVVPPPPVAPPPVSSTPPSSSGLPLLNYQINQTGASASYSTPVITTDNRLKVKFKVGTSQGNIVHQASELKVIIAVNGTEVSPTFTSSNYVYGLVNETSNVIDLSSSLAPGVPVVITVKSPSNDFYCTYWPSNEGNNGYQWNGSAWTPINPLYNSFPGCRKAVYSTHNWSGTLIVETNNTVAI